MTQGFGEASVRRKKNGKFSSLTPAVDSEQLQKRLFEHFENLKDPRGSQGVLHPFMSIIMIALLGTIGGAKGLFCKQSLDMGLGEFFSILEHVCSQSDTYFAKVSKDYTSQICPSCGTHTGKKELDVRVHHCPECGYEQDRDVAAAEVIRIRGLENAAVGTTVVKLPSNGVLSGTFQSR